MAKKSQPSGLSLGSLIPVHDQKTGRQRLVSVQKLIDFIAGNVTATGCGSSGAVSDSLLPPSRADTGADACSRPDSGTFSGTDSGSCAERADDRHCGRADLHPADGRLLRARERLGRHGAHARHLHGTWRDDLRVAKRRAVPADGHGPVAARWKWAFPVGTTEVKSYPSIISGNMPGWFNTGSGPGGIPIRLQNGSTSATSPSGPTPNSFFPIALPVSGILTSNYAYNHNVAPTGLGHLAYDIWVQDSGPQVNGFTVPPITHELMIVCTYWGGLRLLSGAQSGVVLGRCDGRRHPLAHLLRTGLQRCVAVHRVRAGLAHCVPATGHRFNIAAFLNFAKTRGWIDAPNPISGNPGTHVVSVQLGVEAVQGTGDLTLYNFDVKNN
jgi:hypothetical protein